MNDFPDPANQLSPLQKAVLALKESRSRLEALKQERTEKIAIVGIGCRFPAGANSPDAYWNLLVEGRDASSDVSEYPIPRWDPELYLDLNPDSPGKMYSQRCGFLNEVRLFDNRFFGISPREALLMDPQQRLLLEVAWEALEHAAINPDSLRSTRTGVFVGIGSNDYGQLQPGLNEPETLDAYTATGNSLSIAAGRISFAFGFQGPCIALDTSCSSSLVAVHLACESLRSKECDVALAGGVNLILSPIGNILLSKMHAMAWDGHCKTFDAAADGYARGEGCGVVVLRRLSDAVREKERIIAVIRGAAVNQDGPSSGLTVPNGPSQQALLREALHRSSLEPHQVAYIEAHGTGTPLGDPIELKALGSVFGPVRKIPLLVGSAKTNLGHLEAAAGIAGLIKVALSIYHGEIPAHLHFKQPNPYVPWKDLPLTITSSRQPWPDAPRIAGVSSFGMSGTNAHVLLAQPDDSSSTPASASSPIADRPVHILCLSAKTETALQNLAARYAEQVRSDFPSLGDACFSANHGRAAFQWRAAVVARSTEELFAGLELVSANRNAPNQGAFRGDSKGRRHPRIAFIFTGQGSQYVGMAEQLYRTSPTFRKSLDQLDMLLQPQLPIPLLSVLFDPAFRTQLGETRYTQPALFAVEYALAQFWIGCGIRPFAVLGHSVGEFVAACISGILSLEQAVSLIAARARLMQSLPSGGAMAAVFADETRVMAVIRPFAGSISIAAINAPGETVLSGDSQSLDKILTQLELGGVRSKRISVSHAFHSPLMEPILPQFYDLAAKMSYSEPSCYLISNVTGQVTRPGQLAQPQYWADHVRKPVRFADGITTAIGLGCQVFLEIGPHPVLSSLGRKVVESKPGLPTDCPDPLFLHSLRKDRDDWHELLCSLGALFVWGASVDWAGLEQDWPRRRVALPTYPFERELFWSQAHGLKGKSGPLALSGPKLHPLLGHRLTASLPLFENGLEFGTLPPAFAVDIEGHRVLPASVWLELLVAAFQLAGGAGRVVFEELKLERAFMADSNVALRFQVCLTGVQPGDLIKLFVDDAQKYGWMCVLTGRIGDSGSFSFGEEDFGEPEVIQLARARKPLPGWFLCKETLDQVLERSSGASAVPSFVQHIFRLEVALPPLELTTLRRSAEGSECNAMQLLDADGKIGIQLEGLVYGDLSQHVRGHSFVRRFGTMLHEVRWEAKKRLTGRQLPKSGPWLVLGATLDWQKQLALALESLGDTIVVLTVPPAEVWAQPERLLEQLKGQDVALASLKGILFVAAHTDRSECDSEWHRPDVESMVRLIQLAKVLTAASIRPPHLWTITFGGSSGGTDIPADMGQAAFWGLHRSMSMEMPMLWSGIIDLEPESADGAALQPLADELVHNDGEDQIVLRSGQSMVPRLIPGIARTPASLHFSSDATYVVLSLGSEVGWRIASWLGGQTTAQVVLIDSDPAGSIQASPGVRRLRLIHTPDFLAEVAAFVHDAEQLGRPVRGIIHAGGAWTLRPVSDLTAPILEQAWTSELSTLQSLLELIKSPPEFLCVLSSVASVWGAGGMAHHAATHAMLDAIAERERRKGTRVTLINQVPWADCNVLTAEGYHLSERAGVQSLGPDQALELLAALLQSGTSTVVGKVEWSLFKRLSELSRKRPFFEKLAREEPAVSVRQVTTDLLRELADTPTDARHDVLSTFISSEIARVMGLSDEKRPDVQQGFFDLGMDSIMAVELNNRIETSLGRSLPPTATFDYPTIEALSGYILDDLLAMGEERPPSDLPIDRPGDVRGEIRIEDLDGLSDEQLLHKLASELGFSHQSMPA